MRVCAGCCRRIPLTRTRSKSSSVSIWRLGQRNKLYWVRVSLGTAVLAERRVGFRTVALVSHGPSLAGNATGNFTMRFVINGVQFFLFCQTRLTLSHQARRCCCAAATSFQHPCLKGS